MTSRATQAMHTYLCYGTGKRKLPTVPLPEKWVEELLSMETIKSHSIPKPKHLSIQLLQGCKFKPISNGLLLQEERYFRLKTHSCLKSL